MAVYYVSTTGVGGNSGTSEGSPWNFSTAISTAVAGDTVHVKTGNYGSLSLNFSTSGTSGNLIRFIGYKTTIGDIVSTTSPTRTYLQDVDSTELPLLTGSNRASGTAINISGDYVHVENIQITTYSLAVNITGVYVVCKNVITTELGSTGSGIYNGFGFRTYGDNFLLDACSVKRANGEGFNTKGGSFGNINNSYTFSDSLVNGMDYHFLMSGGSTGNVVDNCTAQRTSGSDHKGHGFDMKDIATFNTYQNSTLIFTQAEANFSGVHDNTWQNISIYGEGTGSGDWSGRIFIANGAHDNLFKNIYIQDNFVGVVISDYDDGFVGAGGDRDLDEGGHNNTFENIVVNNVSRFIESQGGNVSPSDGNTFKNITLYNVAYIAVIGDTFTNVSFINCGVHTLTTGGIVTTGSGSITYATSTNNKYYNTTETLPAGWASSADPTFVDTALEAVGFKLQTGSPWIDAGSALGSVLDFEDNSVVTTRDVGAFEFGGVGGDVTAPSVVTLVASELTENTFKVTWTLDEGSKGSIEYGTTSGVYTEETTAELTFITTHIQTVGGNNAPLLAAGTTYFYRVKTEDATGNLGTGSEQSITTLGVGQYTLSNKGAKLGGSNSGKIFLGAVKIG